MRRAAVLLAFSLAACGAGTGALPGSPGARSLELQGAHAIAEFVLSRSGYAAPFTLVPGRDGSMWFSEEGTGAVGRIVATAACTSRNTADHT